MKSWISSFQYYLTSNKTAKSNVKNGYKVLFVWAFCELVIVTDVVPGAEISMILFWVACV